MIGRYRSKFKQFDDNNNLLCYSCKNTNHWIALIRTQINGLEQKKIQDANNARKKHVYVENSRIEERKI